MIFKATPSGFQQNGAIVMVRGGVGLSWWIATVALGYLEWSEHFSASVIGDYPEFTCMDFHYISSPHAGGMGWKRGGGPMAYSK